MGNGLCVIGRADQCGLAAQTVDFCQAMRPEKVYILDCRNGRNVDAGGIPNAEVLFPEQLAQRAPPVDLAACVVGFETFYLYNLPQIARRAGVRSVLFPNWEWTDRTQAANTDVLINLSDTDQQHYPRGLRVEWPASPAVHDPTRPVRWPPRTFVHLAGNAAHNRNGTKEVLAAAKHLAGTGARLLVYAAFDLARRGFTWDPAAPVEVRPSTATRAELLHGADCLVMPRRLPGHSLPIYEAAGEGIPVVALDLPDWKSFPYRVPAHAQLPERFGRVLADVWRADPDELGLYLRGMATGDVPFVEGPKLPTWDTFREWFWANVMGEEVR